MRQKPTAIADLISDVDMAAKTSKALYDKHLTHEEVDFKSHFTDLVSILTHIKMTLAEFQEVVSTKDKQISDLEWALKFKDKLVCIGDAYYEVDSKGKPTSHANCIKCWENDYKKRTLVVKTDDVQVKICPTCEQTYARAETEIVKKRFKLF
jgi:hypothetical protein